MGNTCFDFFLHFSVITPQDFAAACEDGIL